MSTKNGGPAFPCNEIYVGSMQAVSSIGISMRDYFAAKAMQGLLAGTLSPDAVWSLQDVAETSYNMADAMLRERQA